MMGRILFVVCAALTLVLLWVAVPAATAQSGEPWGFYLAQSLHTTAGEDLALGDLDGDGDLDAVVANGMGQPDQVWINQGGDADLFTAGPALGDNDSRAVALGNLDGQNGLDIVIVTWGQGNKVWLNDGSGGFHDSTWDLGAANGRDVALGDLDGDGDLDVLIANEGFAWIWLNQGGGSFAPTELPVAFAYAVALGDLNGDAALDAFFAFHGEGNQVWLNRDDGTGVLEDSGLVYYSSGTSRDVALGDVDGQNGLDAVVATDGAEEVWLNNGNGTFAPAALTFGGGMSTGVALGDVEEDGDLDAMIVNDEGGSNPIYLNNGSGAFTPSTKTVGDSWSRAVAMDYLNDDGGLDVIVVNSADYVDEVYLMTGGPTGVSLSQMQASSSPNWTIPAVALLGMATLLLAWRRRPRRG